MNFEFGRNRMRETLKSEPAQAEDFEEDIETLLDSFPEENRPRLVSRIQGKSREEQVAILANDLEKRRETLKPQVYRSERLTVLELGNEHIGVPFDIRTESSELGRGDNGVVFEYERQERENEVVVFKMFTRQTLPPQNDIFSEGAYQADVADFATHQKELRVGVPQIHYIAKFEKGYALAMEKVPGYSIRDIQLGNIMLPDDFDFDAVGESLGEFVTRMNEAGFYHRDLREGNIMIDPSPKSLADPRAYIIDYGLCIKAGSSEQAYQGVDGNKDYVTVIAVLQQLKRQQARLRSEIV